jgi:Protein of unknown function (DUF2851)
MDRKPAISESFLAQVWQQQLAGREPMVTAGGDTVEVLHPGRPTNDCGPDFRDALIAINGRHPLQGDIELHVNARDWQTHGHHQDPNYDRVILHVALRSHGMVVSPLCNGRAVPVLALSQSLSGSTDELREQLCQPPFGEEPCYQAFLRYGRDEVTQVVEEAGDERFRNKARKFEAALVSSEADQVLYEGLMRALGYSQNKEPFQKLARLLPISAFEGWAKLGDHVRIQAVMLGTAGLLPSQRSVRDGSQVKAAANEPEVEELERMWVSSAHAQAMNASEWRFHGIRPENSPTRRMVAASHLLTRHQGRLLQSILPAMNRLPLTEIQDKLEESLKVKVDGYWASHFDFAAASGWCQALIGQSRARDIIVNVVLPFCFAWGSVPSQDWLQDVSFSLYHNHPGLEENWITRHMKAKVLGDGAAKMDSARQQQGLIQLNEAFCAGHKCHDCPLGGGRAAGHGQPAGASDLLDAKRAQ